MDEKKLPFEVLTEMSIAEFKTDCNCDIITFGTSANNKPMFKCGATGGAISEAAYKVLNDKNLSPEAKLGQLSMCKLRFHEDNKELWVMRSSGFATVLGTL